MMKRHAPQVDHTGQADFAGQRMTSTPAACEVSAERVHQAPRRLCSIWYFITTHPLVCVSAGLCTGSILGTWLAVSPWLIGSIMLAAVGVSVPWRWPDVRRCSRLFLAGLLLTHGHALWQQRALPVDHIARAVALHSRRPVTVEGTIYRAIDSRGDRQRVYLQLQRWQPQHDWHSVRGRIRLTVHTTDLPFLPGDTVRVERLRVYAARGFLNPGGFNFQQYMQWQGIHTVGGVSNPRRIHLQHRPPGLSPARVLERWRRTLRSRVQTALEQPYAGIFLAMVLGDQSALTPVVQDHFRGSGTAHLLVVSGLHVGFMTTGLLLGWQLVLRFVRSWLPRPWVPGWRPTPLAVLLSLPLLMVYCSLVGWKVSTTRAALMVVSALAALALGRQRDLAHALLLAAALIVLGNPTAVFTIGFQLSFVAVAGILLASHALLTSESARQARQPWGKRLGTYLLISSAAYASTLPILVGAFHVVPTLGIPANVLLVPLAGVLVPAGVVALGLMAIWPALGVSLGALFAPVLRLILALVEAFASLPWSQLHLAAPSVPMLCGYYGILGSLCLSGLKRWRLPVLGVSVAVLVGGWAWQYLHTQVKQLHVTFLDVGTGDAIFVQAPGGHSLLIDGGGTYDGRFDIGAQVVAPFLWDRHVRRLDLMAMTHPQANHARGLVSVLRLFPTGHLLTNGTPLTADYLRDLVTAGQRWHTQQHTALDGPRQWQWGDLRLTVLAPPSRAEQGHLAWHPPTENDRSLVLQLQYGTVRLLLTGDIHQATERWLLAHRHDLQADILHIPHHGSKTSTSAAFLERVRPRVGIISLGAGNPYGHPHPQVLQTLQAHHVRTFRTDYHGAITITSDGTRYEVTPWRRR